MCKQVEQKVSLIEDAERTSDVGKSRAYWRVQFGSCATTGVVGRSRPEWQDTWPVGDEVIHYSDGRLTNYLNACLVSSFHALLCATCMYASKPMCYSSQL